MPGAAKLDVNNFYFVVVGDRMMKKASVANTP